MEAAFWIALIDDFFRSILERPLQERAPRLIQIILS